MKWLIKFIRVVNVLNRSMFYVIGTIILFLSFLVFYDVIARYFFSSPTSFGFDLSIWLTGLIAFLGGGYVLLNNEHVNVDIFYKDFSIKKKSLINLITHLFILMVVISFIVFGGAQVIDYFEKGHTATSGFNIPLWARRIVIPIGGILLGLQVIVLLIKDIFILITGEELREGE